MRTLVTASFLGACLLGVVPTTHGQSTPTPGAFGTSGPTLEPTLTPTSLATPTSTTTPKPRSTLAPEGSPSPSNLPHRRRKIKAVPVAETATPTPTPHARHRKKHHRKKVKPTATVTPRPTPTPTPPLSLSTEDSIKPVTCNGPAKGVAPRPFLSSPFHGWTSIVSYFDHDSPNFGRDDLMVPANGLQARPDQRHLATDFPAYWSGQVRQYLYYDGHNGYDFNVTFQSLYASAKGKVIFAGWEYPDAPDHGYGRMIMIAHRFGYVTLYGHLSKIKVRAGQRVRTGQFLGISGNTGHSTGPHLHFTVFHNCTPTDPYGWSGQTPDPLASYANETSTYLWRRQPLITNPLPGLAGLDRLPATSASRLLLLRLPDTSGGTNTFLKHLRLEATSARKRLGSHHIKIDLLRGGLDLHARVSASTIYKLSDVVSIAAPDVGEDAKTDMLSALAGAGLSNPRPAVHRSHHPAWTGYFLRWQGRTFLLGRGPKARQVKLRLSHGRGGPSLRSIRTDPITGAYAVDLGFISPHEAASLKGQLEGGRVHSVSTAKRLRNPARHANKSSRGANPWWLAVIPLLALVGMGFGYAFRRRAEQAK